MSVSSVTTTSAATSAAATTGKGKSTLGKDDFLKLMIEQLKNQDPMDPTDATAYTSQLAQFSSLEQLSNISSTLDNSVNANYALTQSINNTMTAALIGKDVKISGSTIKYNGEDSATIGFNLPAQAASATVTVYDKYGSVVKTINSSEKSKGDHKLSWDFSDNNGERVSLGEYTFKVEAKSLSGTSLTASTWTQGTISSIRFGESGTTIVVGKSEYLLSDISEILNPSN